MIERVIRIPDGLLAGQTGSVEASVQTDGYSAVASWRGWGRNRDGSVRLDFLYWFSVNLTIG